MTGNIILQDLSPTRTAHALDANTIAFAILLGAQPHAAFHDEPGLRWYETGIPDSTFNGVVQTDMPAEILPTAVQKVLTHFRQRHLPFHWRVGPSSHPTGIGDILTTYGISHDEDEPGMAVDLLALNENLPLASHLVIHPVTTDDLLRQWIRAWGSGVTPEAVMQNWYTAYSGLPPGPDKSLRLYVGTIDSKPVATVALFLEAGVAAIHHVVTIHEFRRQGIGATMTLMAAQKARDAGYRVGVLTASPSGINIYRQLGFQECCMVSTYRWEPTNG